MVELVRNGMATAILLGGGLLSACAKPADSTRTTSSNVESEAPRTAPSATGPSQFSAEPAVPKPAAPEAAAPEPAAPELAVPEPATPQRPAPRSGVGTEASTPIEPPREAEHVREFQGLLQQNQACKKDSDCELIMPGCPFGCYAAVSATSKDAVQKKLADLHNRLSPRCAYRCVGPPAVECQQGSCALRRAD